MATIVPTKNTGLAYPYSLRTSLLDDRGRCFRLTAQIRSEHHEVSAR